MTLMTIRLALLILAGGMTTLGLATPSADGENLTIHIGPLAAFLSDWGMTAGGAFMAAWLAMWRSAKKTGGMT